MSDAWKYLSGLGSGIFLTVLIGYIIFKNPDTVKKWVSLFCELLSLVFDKCKYKATKYSIESKINGFVDKLSNDSDIDPVKVKIKWTARAEQESCLLEEDEVVIVMRDRKHNNSNFVHAAYFFTSSMLLWRIKKHISQKQRQAIDIFTTKKIIEKQDTSSLRIFLEKYFQPLMEDENINELVKKFVEIDACGYYTNILITELSYLGYKTLLDASNSDVIIEVKSLIEFLYNFANRELGDEHALDTYIGKYTRCSIKIVSTSRTRIIDNTDLPVRRIKEAFSRGIENVYIIGPYLDGGKDFIDKVCRMVLESRKEYTIQNKKYFSGSIIKDGRRTPTTTYFIHIQNPTAVSNLVTKDMVQDIAKFKSEEIDDYTIGTSVRE